jgi:hypothetical protein
MYLVSIASLLVVSSCGGGGSSSWKDLRAVRVTLSRPGIPPPGGLPHTTSFTSPSELAVVTAALNKHHIEQGSSSSNDGCAGGENVAISITHADGSVTNLSAYRCAGQTTGEVSGDLLGFLNAAGVPGAI